MILTCTSCSTRYYADDSSIGASGRTVRCAACGHSWFAEPQLVLQHEAERIESAGPEPLTRERVERLRRAAEQPGPAPSAAAKFRQQQADRMRRDRNRAALAASAAGMVVFRQDVAELWPRSASAFAALGLDVNVYGLEFYDLSVERAFDGPTPILLVSGEVRNIGHQEKLAPPLRLSLRDSNSHELYHVVHVLSQTPLAAGASAPFQIRVENPPADAVDMEAAFASMTEAYAASQEEHQQAAPAAAQAAAPANGEAPLELRDPISVDGHGAPAAFNTQDGLAPRFSGELAG
jgi:predicted Zn finger-like uncharacterized protein